MKLDDLVNLPGSWLSRGRHTGTVVSSRIRLARNLNGNAFPSWAGPEECRRVCDSLCRYVTQLGSLDGALYLSLGEIESVDKQILKERQLISQEMLSRDSGSALVVSPDESIAVMINEEDHLRMQAISPGFDLEQAWQRISRVDDELDGLVEYAFSTEFGYLTACPTNVGTGLRASAMLHLPGLKLIGEVDAVIRGLNKIGLTVRGVLGEGSEAWGQMYQISNQRTLGESETEIIERLGRVVDELVVHEENARQRLMEDTGDRVWDYVGRAYGILTYARVLSSQETMDLLSAIRLGLDLELVKGTDGAALNELMLLTQPGHLQKISEKGLKPEERDVIRAKLVRERLSNVVI